jgi:F-type H+-transporting ATPase subunit a
MRRVGPLSAPARFPGVALAALLLLALSWAAAPAQEGAAGHAKPEKKEGAMEHTLDNPAFHFFDSIPGLQHVQLPKIFGFQITRYMVYEVIAAVLIVVIFVPLARRAQSGQPPRGAWDNLFESLLTFVRNSIARPCLGPEAADRYLPFLWTMGLFILFNNLLGMVPFLGSATASIYVTGALALIVFFVLHGSAIMEMGRGGAAHHNGHGHGEHIPQTHAEAAAQAGGVLALAGRGFASYIASMWPPIDLGGPAGLIVKSLVFVIEVIGVLVRNAVLAVRLFANMFSGHMVLGTILFFIQMAANLHWAVWGAVTLSSVFGIIALSLLEIFVAFLQAYIFTFLTALFMGLAMHPQH